MMSKLKLIGPFLMVFVLLSGKLAAQASTTDQIMIALYDKCLLSANIYPTPVSMTLGTSVAGSPVSPVSNSNLYMKVTSVVPLGTTRKITAIVTNGAVPAGTILNLTSAPCTGINSQGTLGTVISTPVTLNTTSNQTLIDNIGSCYTGTSTTDGYQMTFTWQPDGTNYYLINATPSATALTITLTISNNN